MTILKNFTVLRDELLPRQLPLASLCFCWFRGPHTIWTIASFHPWDAQSFAVVWLRATSWLATSSRRGGDAICLKTGKNQSYTNGFCHGNVRTREPGWKIDHRLRTFQLNVSFVFFSIFLFHFLEHGGESSRSKNSKMYAESPLKSRQCTEEPASAFSFPF